MPKIDNSVILFLAWVASQRFDRTDCIFNSAQFAGVVSDLLGRPALDGYVIELILTGREGIEQLGGGAHWRIST